MEELDEEARLDRGAGGEVQAQQVMTLLLIRNGNQNDCRIKLDIRYRPNIAKEGCTIVQDLRNKILKCKENLQDASLNVQ